MRKNTNRKARSRCVANTPFCVAKAPFCVAKAPFCVAKALSPLRTLGRLCCWRRRCTALLCRDSTGTASARPAQAPAEADAHTHTRTHEPTAPALRGHGASLSPWFAMVAVALALPHLRQDWNAPTRRISTGTSSRLVRTGRGRGGVPRGGRVVRPGRTERVCARVSSTRGRARGWT